MDQGEYAHQEQKRNNLLIAKIEQKKLEDAEWKKRHNNVTIQVKSSKRK